MTNGKDPFDDSDSERTVIKPNPGGRRDSSYAAPTPQTPSTDTASSHDIWGGTRQSPGTVAPQPIAYQSQPALPPSPIIAKSSQAVDLSNINAIQVKGGKNIFLEAAMPLLLLLANVRIARAIPQVGPMMNTVAQGIETFEATLIGQNIPQQQVHSAKYALCATADDIVQNLPRDRKSVV